MHDEELIAVSKEANRAKGQKDPANWLPTNEDYLCKYISNWIIVKDRWDLWVDEKEQQVLQNLIERDCADGSVIFH